MFLMLSVGWIVPIQVKAVELHTAKDIEEKIIEMGNRLEADDNFAQLIALHENKEIKDIFVEMFNTDSDVDVNLLAQQYVDTIGMDQLNYLLTELNDCYAEDFSSVTTSLNKLFKDTNTKDDSSYFRVEEVDDKLKITKLDSKELKEGAILFSLDGEMIFTNGQSLSLGIWQNLADFCGSIAKLGVPLYIFSYFIQIISIVLSKAGFDSLANVFMEFGYYLTIIAGMWTTFWLTLSVFFEKLAGKNNSSRIKLPKMFLLDRIRIRLLKFLSNFFHRLSC
jgi:hypothetical protein